MTVVAFIKENELEATIFTGKVLWWSKRDGNGIVVMEDNEHVGSGHEIYVDASVLKNCEELIPKQRVSFNINTDITDCLCGKNVKLA